MSLLPVLVPFRLGIKFDVTSTSFKPSTENQRHFIRIQSVANNRVVLYEISKMAKVYEVFQNNGYQSIMTLKEKMRVCNYIFSI